MRQPVREQEGRVRVEVGVVDDEQHLAAVVGEALDRVGETGREVPEVTLADVVLEGAQLRVDGGGPCPAGGHVCPLGLLVLVRLRYRAGLEAHVDGGDIGGAGQLADRRLPRPAAFAQVIVAVGEGPPEVGQRAVIGSRRHEQIRILGLASGVRRTKYRRTLVVADWLGRGRDTVHRRTSVCRMTRRPSSPFHLTMPVVRPSIGRTSRRVQWRERRPRAHRYSVANATYPAGYTG